MDKHLAVIILLGICSIEDIKNKQIHIIWPVSFAVIGILCWIFVWDQPIFEIIIAVFPGLAVLAMSYATKGGIGEGDSLLLIVAGIYLGASYTIEILLYAVFLSSIYALFLYTVKKKKQRYEMAFVPFLFISFTGSLLLQIL